MGRAGELIMGGECVGVATNRWMEIMRHTGEMDENKEMHEC